MHYLCFYAVFALMSDSLTATDYGHPDRKLSSLNGRKSTPTPKFCLPDLPKFSDFFDLCLHWVSVVRGFKYWTSYLYIALICLSSPRIKIFNPFLFLKKLCNSFDFVLALGGVRLFHFGAYDQKRNFSEIFDFRFNRVGLLACRLL